MKDEVTALELKKIRDNTSWSLTAAVRINDFFTQTDWLPRFDHFWLGQPVLGDVLTWFEHSSAAYSQFHTATLPNAAQEPDPATRSRFLPWEVSPAGDPLGTHSERFVTRQEIDWPFQAGPVKVVPYALGEAAHWGQARDGEDLQRLYGQVGLRASIPVWRVDPEVESALWNVHGLAHKVVFEAEAAWADSNRSVDELPLYDPLDDDSIEDFRRRFVPNTFPSPGIPAPFPDIPKLFDERYYAIRTGMAGWVTAPSTEIADDLMFVRLGMRNRWQTKRGTPGNERIVDWITLDTNITFFPDKNRDDFGALMGLLDYDFRWQIGDRLALLSSGIFDFFQSGQRLISVGRLFGSAAQGRAFRGHPPVGRPDPQHDPCHVLQLPDEPQMGLRLRHEHRLARPGQHRPVLFDHAGRRVVPPERRLQLRRQQRELGSGPVGRASLLAQNAARPGRRGQDPGRGGVWAGVRTKDEG